MAKISRVLVFHLTTPFIDCLQRRIENLIEHLQWSFFLGGEGGGVGGGEGGQFSVHLSPVWLKFLTYFLEIWILQNITLAVSPIICYL